MNTSAILKETDEILAEKKTRDEKLLAICQLLKTSVYHYDWVGFYILNEADKMLELGPYVGKTTDHTRIPVGKGVCGQVAENNDSMIVQDVSKMENYIACSLDVQSEIVVPVQKDGKFVAEIDIDSHSPAPFTQKDLTLLESIAKSLSGLFL